MFPLLTRRAASDAGLKRYYTGRPCKNEHDCQRFTSTGVCVQCAAGYAKSFTKRITEGLSARSTGSFIYKLHPDDHVAALAYCQALDMQRGRVPVVPTPAPTQPPVDLVAARIKAFGVDTPPVLRQGPDQMHPTMRAQLVAMGMLK